MEGPWAGPVRLFLRLDPGAEADLRLFRGRRPGPAVFRLLRHYQRAEAESASYARIAGAIGLPAAEILFLSDVLQELDAARDAGMRTLGLAREGGSLDGHPTVASFADIVVE